MSHKQELINNNTDLQVILDMVNALPESGGGDDNGVKLVVSTSTDPNDFPDVVENAILIAYDA